MYFEVVVRPKGSSYYDGFLLEAKNPTQAKKLLRANGFVVRECVDVNNKPYDPKEQHCDYIEWEQKTFDDDGNLIELLPKVDDSVVLLKDKKDNKATIIPMIKELEDLFVKLNDKFFDGELETPVITIAPDTYRAYGWFTTWRAWKETDNKDSDGYYEINITSDYLDRTPVEIASTLLHEMVHLYNAMNGIKDCSRAGKYHNTKFRDAALAHGLNVEKESRYGYCRTSPSHDTETYLNSLDLHFTLYRPTPQKGQRVTKKSSSRKYVCPVCGTTIRATKEVHVTCSDCGVEFEEVV